MVITEEEIAELYGVDLNEISSGCLDIITYFHSEEKSLPDWVGSSFNKLPRYERDENVFENWMEVLVPSMNASTATVRMIRDEESNYNAGMIFCWLIEKLEKGWCCLNYKTFLFEDKQDAMRFKMVWG